MSLACIVFNRYRYDAFGKIVEKIEYVLNSFYYSGYQYDSETGLYYLRSRYYNPETARFITEDSFTGFYTDPLSLNKYTYCHNNPISYHDPDGFVARLIEETLDSGTGSGEYVPTENQMDVSSSSVSFVSPDVSVEDVVDFGTINSEISKSDKRKIIRQVKSFLYNTFLDLVIVEGLMTLFESNCLNGYVNEEEYYNGLYQDMTEYKTYKTNLGGYYNEDYDKVYSSNFFSNYRGSFVLNIYGDYGGNMSYMNFIFITDREKRNKEGIATEGFISTLNHEYGHNMFSMEKGAVISFWGNEVPSFLSAAFDWYNQEKYKDGSKDEDGYIWNYINQPWEMVADKYGGNKYSVKIKDNDFEYAAPTTEYIDRYRSIKEMPLPVQSLYMGMTNRHNPFQIHSYGILQLFY